MFKTLSHACIMARAGQAEPRAISWVALKVEMVQIQTEMLAAPTCKETQEQFGAPGCPLTGVKAPARM
ncbi:hypothetical protein MES4922_580003 [Mesorhizobium ventifaucium]|uniref:Uncharacterized protein n=1 Tax=Mesorhizobium ventifaucium TaxID=666020 RepID=A0ABN8K988_9HYPH|nr:hypothetical protein MES4922_580003 [Mesorhizobium ventifaucium]